MPEWYAKFLYYGGITSFIFAGICFIGLLIFYLVKKFKEK